MSPGVRSPVSTSSSYATGSRSSLDVGVMPRGFAYPSESQAWLPVDYNQSFVSGHTAIAFTGAGLTCAHHRHLPLYGGGWPDVAICVATLAAASSTAVLRVMSDRHYASDSLLGIGLGLVSGWGLPEWLHYGAGDGASESGERRSGALLPTFGGEGWSALIAPQIGEGTLGLTLIGRN